MKNVLFALLFTSFVFAQKTDSITFVFKKSTYLFDKIEGAKNMSPSLISYSGFGSSKENYIFPENEKSDFTIKIKVNSEKIIFRHNYKEFYKSTRAVFYKDDVVEVNYNTGYPEFTVINRKVKEFDLNVEEKLNLHYPISKFDYWLINKKYRSKKEEEINDDIMTAFFTTYKSKLEQLKKDNKISDDVCLAQIQSVKYHMINSIADTDFSTYKSDLKDESLVWIKSYRYFTELYAKKELNVKQVTKELKNIELQTSKNKTKKVQTIDVKSNDELDYFDKVDASDLFSNTIKEWLLFASINRMAKGNEDNLLAYYEKYKKYNTDVSKLAAFEKMFMLDIDQLKKITEDVVLYDAQKNRKSFNDLLNQNKGKVIYVDLWASWCAPCRASFPASKKLHESNEEVVFLYLSIDASFDLWEKANSTENLGVNSYLILNAKNASLLKELEITYVPRYLIYDKSGKLVKNYAATPNSNKIQEELSLYLK